MPVRNLRTAARLLLCSLLVLGSSGCSKFKAKISDKYVYVTAKSSILRDRVAAVSNRTGNVTNGQKLKVLDSRPRWYKVQTEANEIGWITENAVATQEIADKFGALGKTLEKMPPVATATVRDDVNLHDKPGRETDKFYRLDEGDKLKLFQRSSTVKPATAQAPSKNADPNAPPPPPAMEDWWLVQDSKGRTGWMLARMMDVDVPDAVSKYAEGQRIVAAYVLTTITDPEIEGDNKSVPLYVTATSPYVSGLPYDYDQVRVYTWNLKKHRYETAQRDRNIAGYLPITIGTDPGGVNGKQQTGPAPSYSYTVLAADQQLPGIDTATGTFKPGKLVTKKYRLEGNLTRRVLAPGTQPPPEYRVVPEEKKDKKGKKKR